MEKNVTILLLFEGFRCRNLYLLQFLVFSNASHACPSFHIGKLDVGSLELAFTPDLSNYIET